ncbi:hypothetical protein CCAX7_38840 [Capsulimonas corticalis]|uniref:Uncharacterized protein n=1 Tax=Capsulimonas corticalis TaxID=2219043 RepID=A0A402D3R5_9BACT|nr:amidohydrolase family protein [Capsulimonas corticalis]BDI31833.1 hypothetical protein CCAX7_38840 [Capsulimonas corticalis]
MEITDVNTLFGAYPSKHPDSTAETLVSTMQGNQVSWCLTLSSWGLFYNESEGNAETLRACRTNDHLIPVATMNPREYWGQGAAIERLLQEPFEMFRFFPHAQGWPIDFAPFEDVLAILAKSARMSIMVSVSEPGDATQLLRVLIDYPHPVILEGVSSSTLSEAVSVMRRNEHIYLETHALTVPDALPLLRDTVGIRRVLFGSDAPGLSLGAALRYVRGSGLSEADQNAVLGGNAQAIWQSGEGA